MLIKQGSITVNGKVCSKPNQNIKNQDKIEVLKELYVSRGAYKLKEATEYYQIGLGDLVILDVGASTGGFTEFCLRQGAEHVVAVDVGSDQLVAPIRNDSRVTSLEKTDIRDLSQLPKNVDLVVMDVSFISIKKVIPHLLTLTDAPILTLFKPQFEVGKKMIGKKGVVAKEFQSQALSRFETWLQEQNINFSKVFQCGTLGKQGNQEYFYLISR